MLTECEGYPLVIHEAIESDAQALVELFCQIDSETQFMMMEPGERDTSLENQKSKIKAFSESKNKLMAVASMGESFCGFIVASCGAANRNKHSAYMVTGVVKSHWGKGIATALIQYMEHWAHSQAIHRIEFTVIETNSAARSLYKKCGYEEEGLKRDSLKIDDVYVNEVYLSKLLV
jgi:RimJ/RimL family protein N-acetyltransferase